MDARDIEALRSANARLERLNRVLDATRRIGQVIARAKNREDLLDGVCASLTETRGYHNAWVALFDADERLTTSAESGLDAAFQPMADRLRSGRLPRMAAQALEQASVLVCDTPATICTDCPLAPAYEDRGALVCRLSHGDRVFGLLCVSIPAALVADPEEQALFHEVARDIAHALQGLEAEAERRRAEAALQHERNLSTRLIEDSPLAIVIVKGNGGITFANRQAEETLGLTRDAIRGRRYNDPAWRIGKADGTPVPDGELPFSRVIETGSPVHGAEHTIRWPDGTQRCLLINGAPLVGPGGTVDQVIFAIQDITDLRAAEALLAQHSFILEHTPHAVYVYDEEGRIVYANAAAASQTGRPREELVGLTIADIDADFPMATYAALLADLASGATRRLRTTHQRPDGSRFPVALALARLDIGERRMLCGIARDTTEEDAREQALEERLHQMEKMDAIGQLAGGVAHDFNNQLAGVMGYSEMLAARLEDPALKRYAENILIGAHRAADLTRQLLAFSRQGQYRNVPVNLHATLAEVVAILEHTIDKRIEIEQILKANPPVTHGDPSQLQSALLNLALNARDATPDGGRLRFTTDTEVLDEEACRALPFDIAPGPYIRLTIADTGCGMDRETQKHIFEPFFTTKEVGRGIGMGLAAVYGTLTHHDGAIAVDSQPGAGTTFTLYLPPLPDETVGEDAPRPNVVAAARTACILVIDDEELFRDVTGEMLTSVGYGVDTCEDGAAGVAFYKDHWRTIDLVVLDLTMPKLSGHQVFERLQAINPEVKVLLASGYSMDKATSALLARGAQGFLQKPFTQPALTAKVAEILGAS